LQGVLPDGRDDGVAVRVEDEVALAVEEVRAAVSEVRGGSLGEPDGDGRVGAAVPDLDRRGDAREQQRRGELRSDVSVEAVGTFLGLVADGAAVHIGAGYPVDVESVVTLVRSAIEPLR
jgi:hypothetical protein